VRGGHLKLDLRLADGSRLSGFGPALGAAAAGLRGAVSIVGTLRRDRWRGGGAPELGIERVEPGG